MKFVTILISLLVLVFLRVNVVAADHSAELFLQLGHSRSVTVVAFSPDGQTLASGSGDNTIIYWDDKSREILTRTVLLPGNQWLVYHPRQLVYDSSYPEGQEEKYAAIRFDGQLRPVYPLQYYRKELKREHGLLDALNAPQPVIQPKWLRLWWDTAENRGMWFTALAFVVVIVVAVTSTLRRRSDPLEIAKQFFFRIAGEHIDQLGKTLLQVTLPASHSAALLTLWPEDMPQLSDSYVVSLRSHLSATHTQQGADLRRLQRSGTGDHRSANSASYVTK